MDLYEDEIVSIEYMGEHDTIDIDTDGNHLFIANGILTHNSATTTATESQGKPEYDQSHIAGGISKINTADTVFTIFRNKKMEDEGVYRVQCLKSRSSGGVGRTVFLGFDNGSLRIFDIEQPDDDGPSVDPSLNGKQSSGDTMSKMTSVRDQIMNRQSTRKVEKEKSAVTGTADQSLAEKQRILDRLKSLGH